MSGNGNDPQYDFTYTAAHQLASQTISDNDYRWQASGNTTDTYTKNALNQYTTIAYGGSSLNNNGTNCQGAAQSFSYDCNGNLTRANYGAGWWTYLYDAENRLMDASANGVSASYSYDPLGRRSAKNVGGVWTMYLGDTQDPGSGAGAGDEIAEYAHVSDNPQSPNWAPVLLRRYVPGPAIDQPIAMVTAAGARTYFHTDRIGSTIAMSGDGAAKAEGPFTYDPYGFVAASSCDSACSLASGGVPYKFTGRRLDPETKLYYYRARYYSYVLGRFLQTDPIGTKDDLNLYAYVGDDPANRVDPSGLAGCDGTISVENCGTLMKVQSQALADVSTMQTALGGLLTERAEIRSGARDQLSSEAASTQRAMQDKFGSSTDAVVRAVMGNLAKAETFLRDPGTDNGGSYDYRSSNPNEMRFYGVPSSALAYVPPINPDQSVPINFATFLAASTGEQLQTLVHEPLHISWGQKFPTHGERYYGDAPKLAQRRGGTATAIYNNAANYACLVYPSNCQ